MEEQSIDLNSQTFELNSTGSSIPSSPSSPNHVGLDLTIQGVAISNFSPSHAAAILGLPFPIKLPSSNNINSDDRVSGLNQNLLHSVDSLFSSPTHRGHQSDHHHHNNHHHHHHHQNNNSNHHSILHSDIFISGSRARTPTPGVNSSASDSHMLDGDDNNNSNHTHNSHNNNHENDNSSNNDDDDNNNNDDDDPKFSMLFDPELEDGAEILSGFAATPSMLIDFTDRSKHDQPFVLAKLPIPLYNKILKVIGPPNQNISGNNNNSNNSNN